MAIINTCMSCMVAHKVGNTHSNRTELSHSSKLTALMLIFFEQSLTVISSRKINWCELIIFPGFSDLWFIKNCKYKFAPTIDIQLELLWRRLWKKVIFYQLTHWSLAALSTDWCSAFSHEQIYRDLFGESVVDLNVFDSDLVVLNMLRIFAQTKVSMLKWREKKLPLDPALFRSVDF